MARSEGGRYWLVSAVVVPVVCVLASVSTSLLVVSWQSEDEEERQRQQALAAHQTALVRYRYALQRMYGAAGALHANISPGDPGTELLFKETRVTPSAQKASDAALEFMVSHEGAARYYEDAPHLKQCAEKLHAMAEPLSGLTGLEVVPLPVLTRMTTEIHTGSQAPVIFDALGTHEGALQDLQAAISTLIVDRTDTPSVCDQISTLSTYGGQTID